MPARIFKNLAVFFGILILGKQYSFATDTLNFRDYFSRLEEIRLVTRQAIQTQNADLLAQYLEGFSPEFIVKLPELSSARKFQNVSFRWVKKSIELNKNKYDNEEEVLQAIHNCLSKVDSFISQESEKAKQLGGPGFDTDGAKEKAAKILQDRIYKFPKQEKEDENEEGNLDTFSEPAGIEEVLETAYKIGMLILILIILGYLIFRLNKYLENKKINFQDDIPIPGGLLREDDPRKSFQLLEKAQEEMSAGKVAEGIRYYYLFLILKLHESGQLKYNPSFTNWEYYQGMKKIQLDAEAAFFITRIFDESHYGGKIIPSDKVEEFIRKITLLTQEPES